VTTYKQWFSISYSSSSWGGRSAVVVPIVEEGTRDAIT
jgi:hypothetical protein